MKNLFKQIKLPKINLILYSWVITFLLSYVFVSQLTPKLMYFIYRDVFDIVMDFFFIFCIWTAVYFICRLISGLVKERFKFIVFWTAAVLVITSFIANSKYIKSLFPGEGEMGELANQLPAWYTKISGWFFSIPGFLGSVLVILLVAAATSLFYLAAKKYNKALLIFASVMSAVLIFNLAYQHNTRFVHDSPDTSLLNYKIKSVSVGAGKSMPQTVHVIVFDSLPYEKDIFDAMSANASKYKNFSALLKESYVYHNARSAGGGTEETFPKLLTGMDGQVSFKNDKAYIEKEGEKNLINNASSIFSLAKQYGDKAYAAGYFHEYCYLFKNSLDGCSDYSFHGTFASFADSGFFSELSLRWKVLANSLGHFFGQQIGQLQGNFPLLYNNGSEFMDPKLWASLFKNLVFDYQNFMAKNKNNALFFTHLNIPHIPIVFNSKGEFIGSSGAQNNLKNYQDELLYIDSVLGTLIDDIKKTSDYNKSLIIITADHAFRGSEIQDITFEERHIPLVIKAPYQKERKDMYAEFDNLYLMEILKNYYSGRASGRYDGLLNVAQPIGGEKIINPPAGARNMTDQPRLDVLPKI